MIACDTIFYGKVINRKPDLISLKEDRNMQKEWSNKKWKKTRVVKSHQKLQGIEQMNLVLKL